MWPNKIRIEDHRAESEAVAKAMGLDVADVIGKAVEMPGKG